MRVAVTGKQGQVVRSLVELGPEQGVDILPVGRPEMDLANPESVEAALAVVRPDVVVSAAAYTAVDRAEREPEVAFAVNATGAGAVAIAASRLNVPVIHLSTDYVFSGDKPDLYVETDCTGPLCVYGRSKLEGEQRVAAITGNHAILRTAWVYSPYGANFITAMLRLAETRPHVRVIADQWGCPTSALEVAVAVIAIARRMRADEDPTLRGIFHLSGAGQATWADFADEIFAGLKARNGKMVTVERIGTADYPTPAKRPANSRLGTKKLRDTYSIFLPAWRKSTAVVLDRLLETK